MLFIRRRTFPIFHLDKAETCGVDRRCFDGRHQYDLIGTAGEQARFCFGQMASRTPFKSQGVRRIIIAVTTEATLV